MSDLILVELVNNKPTTTSLKVAQFFGKDHSKVLRDIKTILDEDTQSNFGLSEYKDISGKTNPMYIIDKDGFTLLAMGFTGQKAFEFKKNYIKAFNEMESELLNKPQKQLPTNYIEALESLLEAEKTKQVLELENKQQANEIKELANNLKETKDAKAKDYKTIQARNKAEIGLSINRLVNKFFKTDGVSYQIANRKAWEAYYETTGVHYYGASVSSFEEKLSFLNFLLSL